MGLPRIEARGARLTTPSGAVEAVLVAMGNPHCVVFVDDVSRVALSCLGGELESHGRFPYRTNVEIAAVTDHGLDVRIWERGVGETASCGTGVAAAAVAAIDRGVVSSPVRVATRGGELLVTWRDGGVVYLAGAVAETEGEIELDEGE